MIKETKREKDEIHNVALFFLQLHASFNVNYIHFKCKVSFHIYFLFILHIEDSR